MRSDDGPCEGEAPRSVETDGAPTQLRRTSVPLCGSTPPNRHLVELVPTRPFLTTLLRALSVWTT
jgi:hypothetical protein